MGRKGQHGGWSALTKDGPVMPAGPSRFELMLYSRGLSEAEVLAQPRLVEDWVRKHVGQVFVPEKVLTGLGLWRF